VGVDTRPSALAPGGLRVLDGDPLATELFREGRIYVQDDASQAAALVPPPRPGELILDAAASPGGKGFALEASESSVSVVAADLSLARMQALRDNNMRLKLEARLVVADARRTPFANVFDRIVLDLPCSGTGTISRHPELKWRLTEDEIVRLSGRGRAMLEASADLVRAGGLICVVTCSLEVEENEYVVRQFLKRHRDFEVVDLDGLVGESIAFGIEAPGRWRVLTTPEHDGFTVHVLRRMIR
jgi:16S rRNA (cytosine967-C5)-methyltransferase